MASEFAGYKEELDYKVVKLSDSENGKEVKITAFYENVLEYIESMKSERVKEFAIVDNKLYYLGEDEISKGAAKMVGIYVGESSQSEGIKDFQSEVEDLGMSSLVENLDGNSFTKVEEKDGEEVEVEIGEKLVNKELGAVWDIVTEVENNSLVYTYGTGWTYIKAGEVVDKLGKLENDYMINYSTKKAVQFDSSKHVRMSAKDNLVAEDYLLLNLDPSVMEEYNNLEDKSEFQLSKLGNNIRFYGYQEDSVYQYEDDSNYQNSWKNPDLSLAFGETSFKFDGIDDYIRIEFQDNNDQENKKTKSMLGNKGLTFEFYGKIRKRFSFCYRKIR